MGQPRPLFNLFSSFLHTLQSLQQINEKNVHPVHGDGIRTHDLWNTSLLPPEIKESYWFKLVTCNIYGVIYNSIA